MIEQLQSTTGLKEILLSDRYANLFFINDLAFFESGDVSIWKIDGLYALNWRNEALCLYASGPYDMAEALAFLDSQRFMTVMGPAATMEPLKAHYTGARILERDMLALDRETFTSLDRCCDTRLLTTTEDLMSVLKLYDEIGLFGRQETSVEKAKKEAESPDSLYCGTFIDGELVSSAALSAIAGESAMVTGVCTKERLRRKGLASHTLSFLLEHGFNKLGLSYVCLWYSDDRALAVYRKLGFKPVSKYISISLN